jgi:hypothetical protein
MALQEEEETIFDFEARFSKVKEFLSCTLYPPSERLSGDRIWEFAYNKISQKIDNPSQYDTYNKELEDQIRKSKTEERDIVEGEWFAQKFFVDNRTINMEDLELVVSAASEGKKIFEF